MSKKSLDDLVNDLCLQPFRPLEYSQELTSMADVLKNNEDPSFWKEYAEIQIELSQKNLNIILHRIRAYKDIIRAIEENINGNG